MKSLDIYTPYQVLNQIQPAPVGSYNRQLLAQGDSWFSLGAIPPIDTGNLLMGMQTTTVATCVINFAYPGRELRLMADTTHDPMFVRFLSGTQASRWGGLLLSGGGNDLIAAAQVGPGAALDQRLLRSQAEWGPQPSVDRYVSQPGLDALEAHLRDAMARLLALRDAGPAKGIPILWHDYDFATPRNCGAGFGVGPWLYKAMVAYEIPEGEWIALAHYLLAQLSLMCQRIGQLDPAIVLIATQGACTPAATTDTGPTADWENEIHPTVAGYAKLGQRWTAALDAL